MANLIRNIRTESNLIQFAGGITRSSDEYEPVDELMRTMRAIPGVDPAPVQLLPNLAMVIPHLNAPPLRCLYLAYASAFLDRRFREYDFRRGAADARHVARNSFGITTYDERPEEFYTPDLDSDLSVDISNYEALIGIPSSRDPDRSVHAIFEDALEGRLRALIHHFGPSGFTPAITDLLLTWLIKSAMVERLPRIWNNGE